MHFLTKTQPFYPCREIKFLLFWLVMLVSSCDSRKWKERGIMSNLITIFTSFFPDSFQLYINIYITELIWMKLSPFGRPSSIDQHIWILVTMQHWKHRREWRGEVTHLRIFPLFHSSPSRYLAKVAPENFRALWLVTSRVGTFSP